VTTYFISDDRSGSHPANTVFEPSNQAHYWTDRCEPMVPLYLRLQRCSLLRNDNASCRRHATTVRGPAPGTPSHNRTLSRGATRSAVLAASTVNGVTSPRGTLEIAYFGGWKKNSSFYDPRISRPPLTFRSRFCRKFCDLYASIYGNIHILFPVHNVVQFCEWR